MVSPRRIKLPLKQVVCDTFTLMHLHRVDLAKLALPFILFFTWMVGASTPGVINHLSAIFLHMEYHTTHLSIQGSWLVFMAFWMHALYLVQHDKLEWPLSSFSWLKRYAFLTLYGLAYVFLLLGMQLIPFGIFFLFKDFFLNHAILLILFAVPLTIIWALIVFYALIRFSFFGVGVVMDIPSALSFSWRFLKHNVMRVLVLRLGLYFTLSILTAMVLRITFAFLSTFPQNSITASIVGLAVSLVSTLALALSACLDAAIYRTLIPHPTPEGESK